MTLITFGKVSDGKI